MAERLMANILPSNAFEFERTMAHVGTERMLALDTERSRNLWNAWKAHSDDLPYLAWALSVDLWDPTWNDTKKRSVIANAIKHHSIKGTLTAIETYVELVDSKVLHAQTPPSKIFSGASLTREQREAWLSRLPQVRVWRQYERGQFLHKQFIGGTNYSTYFNTPLLLQKFMLPSTAAERLRRRARWVEKGVETDTRVESFESHFRLFKKGLRPFASFTGVPFGGPRARFTLPSTASERVITIEPKPVQSWRSSVGPSLDAVTSEPEIVAQRSKEGKAVYSDRPFHSRYFQPSTAPFRLFERYAVNDGSLIAKNRPSVQFMGVGRYGMPPHTAELQVAIRGKRKRWQAGEGFTPARTKFWFPHNPVPLDKTRSAIVAAKRRSDAVLIDTNTKPGFIAGLPFWAGDDEFIA
jgi:phage tail P2-like protein